MNVATITENRLEAREKYAEYLRAVKARHTDEYEALKNAYRELSRGRQVIDIVDVMRTAGHDNKWRPNLAVMRADQKLCYFRWSHKFRGRKQGPSFNASFDFRNRPRARELTVLPFSAFKTWPGWKLADNLPTFRAVVPLIPPSLMPKGKLGQYHILWEAEWEELPVDPMLLKSLGKNLYVVLAQWDLTPLERATLSERR